MKSQINQLSYNILEAVDQISNHLCQCPVHFLRKPPELNPEFKIIDIVKTVISAQQSSEAFGAASALAAISPESLDISISRLRDGYPEAAKMMQFIQSGILPKLRHLEQSVMIETAKRQMEHILGNEDQYAIECVLAAHKLQVAFEEEARQSDKNTTDSDAARHQAEEGSSYGGFPAKEQAAPINESASVI